MKFFPSASQIISKAHLNISLISLSYLNWHKKVTHSQATMLTPASAQLSQRLTLLFLTLLLSSFIPTEECNMSCFRCCIFTMCLVMFLLQGLLFVLSLLCKAWSALTGLRLGSQCFSASVTWRIPLVPAVRSAFSNFIDSALQVKPTALQHGEWHKSPNTPNWKCNLLKTL